MQTAGPQRALTGSPSSQQSKLVSDSVQSSTRHTPGKGKKRERTEHSARQSKRDQPSKLDKCECLIKVDELAAITNKDGGLINLSFVDRLILLMRQDHFDVSRKPIDVTCHRSKLVGIIAATEKEDCQRQFIQFGGLPILDDWLQEGHKAKTGDGSSREAEKNDEELILAILNALDKLPIDLEALKACSIGKAVNHLRSHRSLEIQRRARKLVDVWKKRVDFEMKLKDEASGGSGQTIPCGPKDLPADPVCMNCTKTEDTLESTKLVCNKIQVTSRVHPTASSPKENSNLAQLNGMQASLPPKEQITPTCLLLSNEHTSKNTACTVDKNESSNSAVTGKDLTEVSLPETHRNYHVVRTKSTNDSYLTGPEKDLSELPSEIGDEAIAQSAGGKLDSNASLQYIVEVETGIQEVDYPRPETERTIKMVHAFSNKSNEIDDNTNAETQSKNGAGENSKQSSYMAAASPQAGVTVIPAIENDSTSSNLPAAASNSTCSKQEVNEEKTELLTECDNIKIGEMSAVSGEDHQNGSISPCHVCGTLVAESCQEVGIEGDSEICEKEQQPQKPSPQECLPSCSRQSEASSLVMPKPDDIKDTAMGSNGSTREESSVVHGSEASDDLIQKATRLDFQLLEENVSEMSVQGAKEMKSDKEKPICNASLVEKLSLAGMQDLSSNIETRALKDVHTCGGQEMVTEQGKFRYVEGCDEKARKQKASEQDVIVSLTENCEEGHEVGHATQLSFVNSPEVIQISRARNEDTYTASLPLPSLEQCVQMNGSILSKQSKDVLAPSCSSLQWHDFDLNEGFTVDEAIRNGDISSSTSASDPSMPPAGTVTNTRASIAPVAVVAATKGGFFPPASSVHNKSEVGWKGSAATSAFRPAEPRHASKKMLANTDVMLSSSTVDLSKQVRTVLDFDLNVTEEGGLESHGVFSQNAVSENQTSLLPYNMDYRDDSDLLHSRKKERPDLDLNRIDEGEDCVFSFLPVTHGAIEVIPSERQQKICSRPTMLDIDLNDGPIEEAMHELILPQSVNRTIGIFNSTFGGGIGMVGRATDSTPWALSSTNHAFQGTSLPGLNMTITDPAFSAVTTQPVLSFRQPSLPLGTGTPPSPAVIYPTAPTFLGCDSFPFPPNYSFNSVSFASGTSPYSVTSLGTGTHGTATIPLVSSQIAGPRIVTPLVRPPIVMNVAELGETGNFYTWGRQDLDLRASAVSTNMNSRELGITSREPFVYPGGGSSLEEQMRCIEETAASVTSLKRKEPDCRWEQTKAGFRQSAWP